MDNIAKVHDISREDVVIKRIFEDYVIQNKIIPNLTSDLFENQVNRAVCKIILQYYNKYNKFPTMQELIVAMPHSAERNKILELAEVQLDLIDQKLRNDLVEGFFIEAKTKKILTDAAEAIHDRDFTNIKALIQDLQEAVNFTLDIDIGLDVVEDAEEALRRLNETMKAIPSALDAICNHTSSMSSSGGHYRKALSIFLGMPNVGKSIILCNEAAHAYQKGFNVLYVTLELAEELIWERIVSNVTGIDMANVRITKSTNIEELLRTNKSSDAASCGEIIVKSMTTTTTVVDIENVIKEIKRSKGIDLDMLVVDYIGIMKPAKRANSIQQHSLFTMGKEIAEQLRDLAKRNEIAVITASQFNRDGYDTTDASMKQTAGSAGLNDTADLMVTIMQDIELKQNNMFAHTILKNRFGRNMIVFHSQCDYSHMRVRSADPDKIKDYNERRTNKDADVDGFNSSQPGAAKPASEISKQKEAKTSKAGRGRPTTKKSNVVVEETILASESQPSDDIIGDAF